MVTKIFLSKHSVRGKNNKNLNNKLMRNKSMSFKRIGEGNNVNMDKVAWRNPTAEIVKGFSCHISKKLHDIIRSANIALPQDEFSFLLKCDIDWEKHIITINDTDVYFPKQKVSSAFVNYLEDKPEYNGVLHKHPGKLKTFSSTDNTWINQNFQVSLLWVVDEFCPGIINIPSSAGRIQLPVTTTCEPDFVADQNLIDIINERVSKPQQQVISAQPTGINQTHPYMSLQNSNRVSKNAFLEDLEHEELMKLYADPFAFSHGF
jgi:hypothetical protein